MKKIILVILVITFMTAMLMTSCELEKKAWSRSTTYKDPQTIGGYWDVTMQTGQVFTHVRCVYWGVDDDTAVFELDNGTIICQSGACVCVENRSR